MISPNVKRDWLPGPCCADLVHQIGVVLDFFALKRQDDIARLESSFVGWSANVDQIDFRTAEL